jgi:hypothetical protein
MTSVTFSVVVDEHFELVLLTPQFLGITVKFRSDVCLNVA